MDFEGSKNLIEDEMWSKRNSLERMLLGSGGSDILYSIFLSVSSNSADISADSGRDHNIHNSCEHYIRGQV